MSFSDIKDLYNLKKYIFTIRFFPLSFSLLILFLIFSIYEFSNFYLFYSLIFVVSTYIFSILWVRFNSKLKFAKNLHNENKFIEEYLLYNQLQSETLLPNEKLKLNLQKAQLFFSVGNHKRFLELISELSNEITNYPKEEYLYRLLKAFYYEINFDLANAKKELEFIIENTQNNNLKIQVYNNIGRIEEIQKNSILAQSFYEKSFEILKKNPFPNFFPITIHNLLICYAKNNQLEKAKIIIDEYYKLINKKDSKQLLEYSNDLTHYARQINDKKLLQQSYNIANYEAKELLKEKEKLILEISQLRMNYNDNLEFNNYFTITFEKIKLNKDEFSLLEKLNILKELKHVIHQKLNDKLNQNKWIEYFNWCYEWNLSLKNEIENELKNIESSLSSIKIFWINQLIELQKIILSKSINIETFKVLTNYIKESIFIWEEANNEFEQINEIIHFIDEVFAFFSQTQNFQIITIYNNEINNLLLKVELLLNKNSKNPQIGHFCIALSYFFINIKNDKTKAKKWINHFDELNISINHYAQYLRNWYMFCKNNAS